MASPTPSLHSSSSVSILILDSTLPDLVSNSSEDNESVISDVWNPATPPSVLGPRASLHVPQDDTIVSFETFNELTVSWLSYHSDKGDGGFNDEIELPAEPFKPTIPRLRGQTTKSRPNALNSTMDGSKLNTGKRMIFFDRFIPSRAFADPPSTSFRVGKDPEELTPEEKILRRRSPREDPFMGISSHRITSLPRLTPDNLPVTHQSPRLINDIHLVLDGGRLDLVTPRRISVGAVWNVGGSSAALGRRHLTVSGGAGSLLASGTTAPTYTAKFFPQPVSPEEQRNYYVSRVALALDIDRAQRLLNNCRHWPILESIPNPTSRDYDRLIPLSWKDSAWRRAGKDHWTAGTSEDKMRPVPSRPFRILDAPFLRDDFYCSTLAYSSLVGILAVGLGHRVYLWSDAVGVRYSPFNDQHPSNHVTSLSFSSENGRRSILAVGRQSGTLCLWSTFESEIRFKVSHPDSITCVAFKQTKSRRPSERFQNMEVETEELAVGDDLGYIWYYSVEWPEGRLRYESKWHGAMTLVAKISAHVQQICGMSWSPDGTYFATGGNDNLCLIFDLPGIIPPRGFPGPHKSLGIGRQARSSNSEASTSEQPGNGEGLITSSASSQAQFPADSLSKALINYVGTVISGRDSTVMIPRNRQKHRLVHSAAVKAIAFAPWQSSLLATGGGSNDRAIHFFHTPSGACLATINVYAQVTSLIWSKTRREIVATFGFAQPEHPFRIAVFAWPSCKQISAIPWGPYGSSWGSIENDSTMDCGRALYAVGYPGRPRNCAFNDLDDPDDSSTSELEPKGRRYDSAYGRTAVRPRAKEGGLWCSRTVEEGCIIVASSDQTVKFHEVWSSSTRKHGIDITGAYGGSEILEGLEGLEKPGDEIIR